MKLRTENPSEEVAASSEEPNTPLLTPIVSLLDTFGALLVLGMMVIVNIDVFGRWLLDSPLAGTLELTEMGIVAVVFLSLAHTVRVKRLTRSDTFLDFLAKRGRIKANQLLRLSFNLIAASVLAVIAYGQFPRVIDAWDRGYYTGNVGIFTAPTWPLELIILIGALLAAVQFLILAYRNSSNLRRS